MIPWPWWLGALAMAAVLVGHWLIVGRLMAVSGRFTGVVNRIRFGPSAPESTASVDDEMAAMRQAILDEFGEEAAAEFDASLEANPAQKEAPATTKKPPQSLLAHVAFFLAMAAGGALSKVLLGGAAPVAFVQSETYASLFGVSPLTAGLALAGGGILVGFGTRMAGGCTTGHGLCGTGRMQSGSWLATVTFFGAAVAVSFALVALQ